MPILRGRRRVGLRVRVEHMLAWPRATSEVIPTLRGRLRFLAPCCFVQIVGKLFGAALVRRVRSLTKILRGRRVVHLSSQDSG